jgi:predicted amidohydrolase YtcJ
MPIQRHAADTILVNGFVRTLDARDSAAQAVAVRDERIVGLGSNAEMESIADDQTRVIDAGGRTVLPAFMDTHSHFNDAAMSRAYRIDYETVLPRTLAEALAPIRARAIEQPIGTWIQGANFSEHFLAEQRWPTRWELDEMAPDHPTMISSIGWHMVAANSLALKLAGITRDTEDPPGGHIERDERGEPSGVLRERAKGRLDPRRHDSVVTSPSVEQRLAALREAIRYHHEHGIAGVHVMVREPAEVQDFQLLRARDELTLRVHLLIRGVEAQTRLEDVLALGLCSGFGDDWLRLGGIKLSVDGACIWRNAAIYEEYPCDPGNHGIVRIEQDELDEKVALCHDAGLRVPVHAIGQRAVDMALGAFDKALAATPRADHRHRIEHAYLPTRPGQFERLRELGLLLSTQPSFIESFGDGWRHVFGESELGGVMPLKNALAMGLRVQGNSDFPCSPLNPLLHLRSAVARQTRQGVVLDPAQAISVSQGLRLLTTEAAYAGFDERRTGTLELGKLADLIVLSRDPFTVPADALTDVAVELTMVGGEVVYGRGAFSPEGQ